MMPFSIFGIWFRSLLAVAIVVGGIYFLKEGYNRSLVDEQIIVGADYKDAPPNTMAANTTTDGGIVTSRRVFHFVPEWNEGNMFLVVGILLVIWSLLGRFIRAGLGWIFSNFSKLKSSRNSLVEGEKNEDPKSDRRGEIHDLVRPNGSVIRVESYGSKLNPKIVWCHGWGQNSTEWFYQKANLAANYRLIVWDDPGLGLSKKPENNDFRLENFANDLAAVIKFCEPGKVFLAGHSIGGMTILTFCKLFPDLLRSRVAGLILAHTTYTNPVRTTKLAKFYTLLEKPLMIPLLYLTIFAWPLVWIMNWMSYFNGSTNQSTHKSSFAGTETKGQLDFVSRNQTSARPDILARGMLGMLKYDATATLAEIGIPTLVVVGNKDNTTLPEAGGFIAANIPSAELAILSPARHHGLMEHHGWFDKLVTEFVNGLSVRTPV